MLVFYGAYKAWDQWCAHVTDTNVEVKVYFSTGGKAFYKDAFGEMELKTNHVYLFPINREYTITTDPVDLYDSVYLHLIIFPYSFDNIIDIDFSSNEYMHSLFHLIESSVHKKENELMAALSDVLIQYLHTYGYFNTYPENIHKVLDYILLNYAKNITTKDLSAVCGYSNEYFIRYFSQHVGISPYRYLLTYRMSIAANKLLTGMDLYQVSKETGYENIKSFNQAFHSVYGITPKTYQKYLCPIP